MRILSCHLPDKPHCKVRRPCRMHTECSKFCTVASQIFAIILNCNTAFLTFIFLDPLSGHKGSSSLVCGQVISLKWNLFKRKLLICKGASGKVGFYEETTPPRNVLIQKPGLISWGLGECPGCIKRVMGRFFSLQCVLHALYTKDLIHTYFFAAFFGMLRFLLT